VCACHQPTVSGLICPKLLYVGLYEVGDNYVQLNSNKLCNNWAYYEFCGPATENKGVEGMEWALGRDGGREG